MSYETHARISQDAGLRWRIMACAADEGEAQPDRWVNQNAWQFPDATIIAAFENGTQDTQADISDAMILTRVQALRAVPE